MNALQNMPAEAHVWVFQSTRTFTELDLTEIHSKSSAFTEVWKSHGNAVASSFNIFYNRFIVVAVDERTVKVGGCSQDSLHGFIKELGRQLDINFFDRMQIAYRSNNEILTSPLSEFEKLAEQKIINESTIVFNNMVSTKADFDKNWEVPLKHSWHNRVLAV